MVSMFAIALSALDFIIIPGFGFFAQIYNHALEKSSKYLLLHIRLTIKTALKLFVNAVFRISPRNGCSWCNGVRASNSTSVGNHAFLYGSPKPTGFIDSDVNCVMNMAETM